MRTTLFACTGVALALLTAAGAAGAHPEYQDAIPNGAVKSCNACHPGGDTTQTTKFGADLNPLLAQQPNTWWPILRTKDSDGDKQTNGQELGDPCGTWKMGDPPPRTTGISDPGDLNDTSPTPNVPSCSSASSASSTGSGAGNGSGSGAGSSTGAAGNSGAGGAAGGGEDDGSTGAGLGSTPPTVQTGACASIAPTGAGGALAASWIAFAVIAIRRRRRG